MAGEEQKQASDKRDILPHIKKNIFIDILNWASDLPILNKIPGFGYHTKEARKVGSLQEEEVIQRYRYLFDIVKNRIAKLHDIEEKWANYEENIAGVEEGGETKNTIIGLYKNLGLYTTIDIAKIEAQAFQFGTVKVREAEIESLKELRKKDPKIPEVTSIQFVSGNTPVTWENFGSIRGHRENITAIGYVTINNIDPLISDLVERVRNTQEILNVPMPPRNALNQLLATLSKSLNTIKKLEEEHFKYLDKTVIPRLEIIEGKRKEVISVSPGVQYREIRFMHTYKIIKPFVLIDIGNKKFKPMYFNPNKNPYTEELEKVELAISKINEANIKWRIGKLIRYIQSEADKVTKFTNNIEIRFSRLINYYAISMLRNADTQLIRNYKNEKDPIRKSELKELLKALTAELNAILKSNLPLLANLNEDYLKKSRDETLNQIKYYMKELKTKEEDIEKFSASLNMKVDSLGNLKYEEFRKSKNNVVGTSLQQLADLGIDIKGIPEFKQWISKLCYYSTKELEISVERTIDEIIENLLKLSIEDDDVQKIAISAGENIKPAIESIKKEFEFIEEKKRTFMIEKRKQKISEFEQKLGELRNKLTELNQLRERKQELADDINNPLLRPNHPNFRGKLHDEVELGYDENAYPLEVDEDGTVLLDKWWEEINRNEWQKNIILKKPGGKEVWENKVEKGVNIHGVRKIDQRFVGDLDLLDTTMFIENEWDAYRDDYRDGRYHSFSKSIADYLLAAKEGIIPVEPIHMHFDPMKEYITWEPSKNLDIPNDEKRVTRDYKMRVRDIANNTWKQIEGVRKPKHLSPAIDRAAIHSGIIHWGRMYYYENTEGINRWSENPFSHVSSRGISHYVIDFTLRKTYNLEEAAHALRDKEWDYGRRHFTTIKGAAGPFIKAPFDEGGVAPE